MTKVRGKWELGGIKSISGSFSLDVTDISFICNGAHFTRFKAFANASKNGNIKGYFGDAVTEFASISNGSVKWNSGYTIIDFGTEWQTVTEEFYTWLTSKAVELTPSTIFDLTTLHLTGSHLITVKARGAGYIASPASNAVEYGDGSPSGVEIVSWADGTDEQIAAMVAALDDGTLTIEETGWKIGDERKVTLSAMDATGVTESHVTQDVTLVLMDSQHYNLTEATLGGDTKDHFVVGLKNVLANGTQMEQGGMYKTATENASWGGCDRRVWCNNVFRMAIPNALRGCFKQFKVPSATTFDGSSVTETDDYFAMFAEMEVQGVRTYSNSYESAALSQIEWYKTDTNRIKRAGDSGDAVRWITRSLRTKAGWFCSVKSDGTAEVQGTAAVLGLAPFGCI